MDNKLRHILVNLILSVSTMVASPGLAKLVDSCNVAVRSFCEYGVLGKKNSEVLQNMKKQYDEILKKVEPMIENVTEITKTSNEIMNNVKEDVQSKGTSGILGEAVRGAITGRTLQQDVHPYSKVDGNIQKSNSAGSSNENGVNAGNTSKKSSSTSQPQSVAQKLHQSSQQITIVSPPILVPNDGRFSSVDHTTGIYGAVSSANQVSVSRLWKQQNSSEASTLPQETAKEEPSDSSASNTLDAPDKQKDVVIVAITESTVLQTSNSSAQSETQSPIQNLKSESSNPSKEQSNDSSTEQDIVDNVSDSGEHISNDLQKSDKSDENLIPSEVTISSQESSLDNSPDPDPVSVDTQAPTTDSVVQSVTSLNNSDHDAVSVTETVVLQDNGNENTDNENNIVKPCDAPYSGILDQSTVANAKKQLAEKQASGDSLKGISSPKQSGWLKSALHKLIRH